MNRKIEMGKEKVRVRKRKRDHANHKLPNIQEALSCFIIQQIEAVKLRRALPL